MTKYLFFLLILIPVTLLPQDKKNEILYYKTPNGTYLEMDLLNKKGRFCNLNPSDEYLEITCNIKIIGDTLQLYGKTDYHYFQEHCSNCRVLLYCHQRTYTSHVFGTYMITDNGNVLKEIKNIDGQLSLLEYTLNIPIAFLFPKEMEKADKINYKKFPIYARESATKRKLN